MLMKKDKGWISIDRCIMEHFLYKEKRVFSKYEAWIDILLNVNHSDAEVLIDNKIFNVKRGQSLYSLDTWASRWNWNKSKVRRFLNLLQECSMVVTNSEQKTTRLTVCKYDSYQGERNADETQMKRKRHANDTQTTPNNNDNKNNNENNDKEDLLFNQFWSKYPVKVAKEKCKAKFNKLSTLDKDKILSTLDDYTKHKPFKEYRHPNPDTYLNQRRWEDEINNHKQQKIIDPLVEYAKKHVEQYGNS